MRCTSKQNRAGFGVRREGRESGCGIYALGSRYTVGIAIKVSRVTPGDPKFDQFVFVFL